MEESKMNKRGTHVGVILSFIIFVTFIVFLLTAINPVLNTGEDKESLLDYMGAKIRENTSSNFTTITVSILDNSPSIQNCIRLKDFLFDLTFVGIIIPPADLIVKNANFNIEEAYYSSALGTGGDANAIRINRGNKESRFFRVYYSPEFNVLPETSCNPLSELDKTTGYEIGSIQTGRYVFKKNILALIDTYNSDYGELKNFFNVPPGSEFGFTFVESGSTKTTATQTSKAPEIYVKETPVQYIDEQANVLSGFINLEVW
jgi:hypothetical protein